MNNTMVTNKGSTFLEVDPSILENNMMFTQKNEMEEKLLDILSSQPKPTKLITPYPGFCVKTFTKDQESKKIFINICHTESIPTPADINDEKLMEILSSDDPSTFRVPMSIGNPRTENDKSGLPATVYDIAINTTFLKKVEDNNLFKSFFLSVVFEGLQDKYQIEIDMEKYVVLKNRKSMGKLQNHSIEDRGQTIPKKKLIEEISEDTLSQTNTKPLIKEVKKSVEKLTFNTPEQTAVSERFEYRLIREPATGCINRIIAEFKIPNETRSRSLHLEVGEDRILLQDRDKISDLFVPYNINQDKIHAILDRNNGTLRVTMDAADPA